MTSTFYSLWWDGAVEPMQLEVRTRERFYSDLFPVQRPFRLRRQGLSAHPFVSTC